MATSRPKAALSKSHFDDAEFSTGSLRLSQFITLPDAPRVRPVRAAPVPGVRQRQPLEMRKASEEGIIKSTITGIVRCTSMLAITIAAANSSADCLHADIRVGYVQSIVTRASKLRSEELVAVDLDVLSGLGAFVDDPARIDPEIELDRVDFFVGSQRSITLRCEKSLCAKLLGIDWRKTEVKAWLRVSVDCPDAHRIDLAEVLYFEGADGKRKIRFPYLKAVPKRIK